MNEYRALTVALPKGRLLSDALALLDNIGANASALHNGSRRLVVTDAAGEWRFIQAKPVDVSVYVEYGVADLGIVGRDMLREHEPEVYEPLALGFGRCRLVLAGPKRWAGRDLRLEHVLRIATSYPNQTRQYFQRRGLAVEIIRLGGSVEVAPTIGLSDLIVDIVDSGRTLRENGLVEIETLQESEAVLIANRASFKLRGEQMREVLRRFEQARASVPVVGAS